MRKKAFSKEVSVIYSMPKTVFSRPTPSKNRLNKKIKTFAFGNRHMLRKYTECLGDGPKKANEEDKKNS